MVSENGKRNEKRIGKNRVRPHAGNIDRLMEKYAIPSKGKSLSGHFSPEEAVDLLETAANRGRSVSEVITRAVAFGLPLVKKQFPPIAGNIGGRPGQVHRIHTITATLAGQMEEWKVLKKGRTLTGHFRPEQAIDVLETARTRKVSAGRILTASVRIGLPEAKKMLPPIQVTI